MLVLKELRLVNKDKVTSATVLPADISNSYTALCGCRSSSTGGYQAGVSHSCDGRL
jgi:hypothetical protein